MNGRALSAPGIACPGQVSVFLQQRPSHRARGWTQAWDANSCSSGLCLMTAACMEPGEGSDNSQRTAAHAGKQETGPRAH